MKTLYLGNLNFTARVEDVQRHFAEQCITLHGPRISRHNNGHPKGFGFAEVADGDLDAALALNQSELLGRKLVVQVATGKRAEAGA